MLEALLAMPLLLLAAATALQLALVAIAGLLTRHAANLAARAAAVRDGSTEAAREVAARVCAPIDRAPDVERLEPAKAAFADFGDRFPFDSADPARGPRTRRTRAEVARVAFRVTCRVPLGVPIAGPLLARAFGVPDGRGLALSAIGRHRLQSDASREPSGLSR